MINTIRSFIRRNKQQSISIKQEDLSTTQISTEEANKVDSGPSEQKPIINESITGTPFRIINVPDTGWFITLGIQRIGDIYLTRQEALRPIRDKDWQLICNVIVTVIEQVNNIMKQENSKK